MKKLLGNSIIKIVAVILFIIISSTAILSGVGIVYLQEKNYFSQSDDIIIKNQLSDNVKNTMSNIVYNYFQDYSSEDAPDLKSVLDNDFSKYNSNVAFNVKDKNGKMLYENFKIDNPSQTYTESYEIADYSTKKTDVLYLKKPLSSENFDFKLLYPDKYLMEFSTYQNYSNYYGDDGEGDYSDFAYEYQRPEDFLNPDNVTLVKPENINDCYGYFVIDYCDVIPITVTACIGQTLSVSDSLYYTNLLTTTLVSLKDFIIPIFIISLILTILIFVFLMNSAGIRTDSDEIKLHSWDKIPLDLYLLILGILFLISTALTVEIANSSVNLPIKIEFACFDAAVFLWFFIAFCMSCSARYKNGKWWKNTIIYFICSGIGKLFSKSHDKWKYINSNRSMVARVAIFYTVISIIEIIIIASGSTELTALGWFIEKLIATPALFIIVINLRKLQDGGKKIAEGNIDFKIDTNHMYLDFKKHAQNLNDITGGLQKAVDEKMKSERFKTELITNVSHDIKTPLTSIINYVDLLKKEDISPEIAKEYIEVLDRQSLRLKKLTEDLVEASKASTGNINAKLEPTNLDVLLSQISGEYEEKLKNSNLDLVICKPENENTFIFADGKLLFRVFDNLLNNISKYALENTRVYTTLESLNEDKVQITFKNISKYPLNISGDELMERFVRGDISRNTEGSGLGLSIAKSLTEIQNGTFDIVIDGDLFKAVLIFDKIK